MKPASWRDALPLARAVYDRHCVGCCAHIILDDGNYEQAHADWCLETVDTTHSDCVALCEMLARMSDTQRLKLYNHYDEYAVVTLPLRNGAAFRCSL